MGTRNFYTVNASKTFVVLENYEDVYEDEETGEEISETRCCETDDVDYLVSYMHEKLGDIKDYVKDYGHDNHETREGSRVVGSICRTKNYGDTNVETIITCIIRFGYYEAACLDWEQTTYVGGHEVEEIEACDLEFHGNISGKQAVRSANFAQDWVRTETAKIVEEVEKIFTEVSTPYNCIGGFSDGTAMYTKA